MRRFTETHTQKQINVSIYSSEDREAELIADLELIYTNDQLTSFLLFPSWGEKNGLVIKSKKELGWVKSLGMLIEEMFSVTGHREFDK